MQKGLALCAGEFKVDERPSAGLHLDTSHATHARVKLLRLRQRMESDAALESLVHLNPPVIFKYLAIPIEFDDPLVEKVAALPADWTEEPPPPATKAIGDLWVKEARSAVLELPSVIILGEPNYLLNPAHPDFQKIIIGKPQPFSFDPRLL